MGEQDKHHHPDHKTEQVFEIGERLADFFGRVLDKIDFEEEINANLAQIIELLKPPAPPTVDDVWIRARFGGIAEIKFRIGDEIKMKYTLPDDQPDVPFTLDPITGGLDAEGQSIPASDFSLTPVESSDDAVVSVVDVPEGVDADGNPTPAGKAFHIGAPGAALCQTQPQYKGAGFGPPFTAEFAITTGAPVSTTGGGINIPGLTPDAEPPVV